MERLDRFVKFSSNDRSDALHLFVHIFRSADLVGCVTFHRSRQNSLDDALGHLKLVFGGSGILWVNFVVKISRCTSEIFNDDLGFGHEAFIVVAIFCEPVSYTHLTLPTILLV